MFIFIVDLGKNGNGKSYYSPNPMALKSCSTLKDEKLNLNFYRVAVWKGSSYFVLLGCISPLLPESESVFDLYFVLACGHLVRPFLPIPASRIH